MTSTADTIAAVLAKSQAEPPSSLDGQVKHESSVTVAQEGMLAQLRDTVRSLEDTQATLTAKRQELRGQLALRRCRRDPKAAAEFCGDLLASCVFRECVLGALSLYSTAALRHAYIDDGVELVRGWEAFASQIAADIPRLEQLDNIPAPLSARRVGDSYAKAKAAYAAVGDALLREHARRQSVPAAMEHLRADQERLLLWCRQQRAALEALSSARAVQEYCASFHTSVSVMESNVLVLLELAEGLLPDPDVRDLLTDVLSAWTSLVVYAYERLEGALREVHAHSPIERLAQQWHDSREATAAFLERAMALLRMPTDGESLALTMPSVRKCEALVSTMDSFNVLMQHLSTFSQRDKCIHEMFGALRRSLFSKVTPQTQMYSHMGSFPDRPLYADRLAELSDWVRAHSASGAWRAMLTRVETVKALIDNSIASEGSDDA